MRMLLPTQSAGLARPDVHNRTPRQASAHAPFICHHGLIKVWTGDEWEWTACLCHICVELVAS